MERLEVVRFNPFLANFNRSLFLTMLNLNPAIIRCIS